MARNRRDALTERLRRQLLTELRNGARAPGDRLPSTRVVGRQVRADPRVVLAAYRELAEEGLVEMRERSGIFVAGDRSDGDGTGASAVGAPAESWLADVLAQAVARALPAPELASWLERAASSSPPLVAAVVAATDDQCQGIARELAEYYGVEAVALPAGVPPADAWSGNGATGRLPAALRRASFIVTTAACASPVRRLATRLGKPFVSIDVRDDLVGDEWRMLLRRPVHVVVTDARFVTTLRHFFAGTPGADNLHAVVLGRDPREAVAAIPDDATVYVTHAARARLGDTALPGRVLPPARVFSPDCAREIMGIVVRENLKRGRERGSGKR
ncbi:MAG TPA: GntR family transcriptional regulator [Gemmatimonadaceae bacterium]|nr:GntR family transcriptional regulator [Gemmatimonadaceae bacterium]